MNDEKLIALVQAYPALYDIYNSKYMDSNFKNGIWSKLGSEMKMDGSACKSRWNNIRDNFRKSLNKRKTKSGQQTTKLKLYKYSEQLSFLKKFIEDRPTKTNIESEENIINYSCDGESEEVLENTVKLEDENYMESEFNDVLSTQLESQNSLQSTSTYTIPRKSRKLSEHNPATHPVDAFLAGIAPSLKKLSPIEWHYAKGEIFATVQKYELDVLNRQQEFAVSTGSNEMCSFGQPSPTGSYQSSWDSKQSNLSTGHNEET